jgi:peptide deformylase
MRAESNVAIAKAPVAIILLGEMIRDVVKYGHPVLRQVGKPIEKITPEIRELAADMLETMYANNGLGLAAQQVGLALQIAVVDVTLSERPSTIEIDGKPEPLEKWMPLTLVNPKISEPEGENVEEEGCLSVPEITAEIRRAAKISVEAANLDGKELKFRCSGLLARAIQHEVDHLNGILFIDRMNAATRVSLAGRLKRMQKETLAEQGQLEQV